jgi:glycine dehydrogenase subunit 1
VSYVSNTPEDKREMLSCIGIDSGGMEALFRSIPPDLRARSFDLPPGKSELEVDKLLRNLAGRNATDLITFVGGGFYDHYIPAAVDALAGRSEFYALYEAAMMAIRITRRNKIIMDGGVSPIYRKMMYSYTSNLNIDFIEIPVTHGHSNRQEIDKVLDGETAAVILQNPNFFGAVDNHSDISEMCHKKGALVIESVYPVSLGLLCSPREMGVDIVTGEGQSLGIPLSFGGPYLGFMATLKKHVRKMPGRIAGATVDGKGRRGFVLTLQAREQHIRRDKATSNICTNQSLCALRALIFMCLYGREGIRELAQLCLDKAEYAKGKLSEIRGVEVMQESPTFNEFTLRLPRDPNEVIGKLVDRGFAAGFPLGRYYEDMKDAMLVAVTEKRTKQEIGIYAETLEDVLWN